MTQLDPNWQSDALDLSLDYADQTIAVRGGYHRTCLLYTSDAADE